MPWLTAGDPPTPDELDEVRAYWRNVDDAQPESLGNLLAAAREACEAFAPAGRLVEPIPESFRKAQALQAKALLRSELAGGNDGIGLDGLTVTVFPMDWTVKQLLRPRRPGRMPR